MVVSILGGLGLFLLGMAVLTDGFRALAGSALRSVLARAAATPARGTFWGAAVTLVIQSSSATTMTTIGLVSAGLLTFPQALGVVFGANIGTTGTGWLVALLGVNVSLNAAAMPMVFVGALLRLLGRGRWAGAGGALAGFALLLLGLTVLQGGMSGFAARVHPADLPDVSDPLSLAGMLAVAYLVVTGVILTTVMQSSSAAVAATLSALAAGAIGPDQAAALVIGQNIGSAVSSAMAGLGATTAAKRTAVAHVLFNIITALVALVAFPFLAPFILRAAARVEAPILLAAFHTIYNVVGVALLLPLVGPFSRLVERVVPQRGPMLTRRLDRSALTVPAVAVEAARRTVAGALAALCEGVAGAIDRRGENGPGPTAGAAGRGLEAGVREAAEALEQARDYLSKLAAPPASNTERMRLAVTLHALDHAARFAENVLEAGLPGAAAGDADEARAAALCAESLRRAAGVARGVAEGRAEPGGGGGGGAMDEADAAGDPGPGGAVDDLARRAAELADLRRAHRPRTLAAAAGVEGVGGHGELSAAEAIARVDAVRLWDRLAYHAWRAAAHLTGTAAPTAGGPPTPTHPTPTQAVPGGRAA
jgi:phosphate:Na+ symporter